MMDKELASNYKENRLVDIVTKSSFVPIAGDEMVSMSDTQRSTLHI